MCLRMSERSKRIALLGKQNAIKNASPQNQYDSHDDEDKENNSILFDNFEPISNWVLEVEPKVLRSENIVSKSEACNTFVEIDPKGCLNLVKSNNLKRVLEQNRGKEKEIDSFNEHIKKEPEIRIPEDKTINISRKLKDQTENLGQLQISPNNVNYNISLQKEMPDIFTNIKQGFTTNNKKINIISDYKLGKDNLECLKILGPIKEKKNKLKTDAQQEDLFIEKHLVPEDTIVNEINPTISNIFLPLVTVPPREEVENLPISHDPSIIIEEIPYDPYDIDNLFQENNENFNKPKATENNILTNQEDFISDSASDNTEDNQFDAFFDSDEDPDYAPNEPDQCSEYSSSDYEIPQMSPISFSAHSSTNLTVEAQILKDTNNIPVELKTLDNSPLKEVEEEVERIKRKNYTDRRDSCFYCEKEVTHFARHLFTWHKDCIDVQRILSYKSNSKERRHALSTIKKKGNFVRNRTKTTLRPVKRAGSNSQSPASEFLPCSHCLGFYKKKSLYRHTKQCSENPDLGTKGKRQTSQSLGQTTLLLGTLIKHDELLKTELFPHMRADEIGLIAKKDPLICNYAYSYLKGRKSKGNLDLVRQDMRRLAKLLKFARHENTDIKDLIDLLRPCFFQIIIKCVSKIGCYNSETDMFESPTVAINFGTLLKKCCDLAYIHLIQKPNTNDQRKEVKVLKTLVTSQWANEISAQASTNLNSKKWNKEDLLPLTSDLVKLNNFLKATAEDMYDKLKTDETNSLAYNCLKDVLYIQIILLNRKRPAEVAQLKVETYKSINLDYKGINEFESCLTEIEKMLLSSYSRIVIRGKRGRGVPILLSKNMKKYFDLLVEVRDNYINGNDYIFHTNGRNCIDGTKILYKYAKKCGVQHPEYINATRLRKHLATITQLLQFSEKDLEQLAKFMGHTLNIHCNTYRLSDNLYQTAKVSKLLLLASEGGIEQYKGMNLDDINMDLNPISEEHDRVEDIIAEVNEKTIRDSQLPYEDTIQVDNTEHATTQFIETKTEAVKKTPTPKQSWTVEQKKIIFNHFFSHIESKRAPKLHEVKEFQEKYPDKFKHRKWTSIKAVVFNIYTNKLKM